MQLLAELDVLAVLDEEGRTLEHRVGDGLVAVVGREDDACGCGRCPRS